MSNRARRKHIFRQRMRAAVRAGTIGDIEQLGDVRHAFRAIRRRPLRMPNLKSTDNLLDIQARNVRPDDHFDLLDDDLELLREGLRDFIGWEDYMEAVEKTERVFDAARDILEPLRRVHRAKFNWAHFCYFDGMDDEAYLDDVVDYIAPIRRAAREIWRVANSITQHLRGDSELRQATWWLPSAFDHRRGRWPVWPPFGLPLGRVPDYAAMALVSMHEAYQASMAFQGIVRRLDEEARQAGIDIDDRKSVSELRERLAGFERDESRYAYAQLNDAKDYLAAARLAISAELGEEETKRQAQKAVKDFQREISKGPRAELVPSFLVNLLREKVGMSGSALHATAVRYVRKNRESANHGIPWKYGSIWLKESYESESIEDVKIEGRLGKENDPSAKVENGKSLGLSAVNKRIGELRKEAEQRPRK